EPGGGLVFGSQKYEPLVVESGRRVSAHCFRIVIYNGWRNSNVSAVIGSQNIPSSWGREPHVIPRRAPLSLSSMAQPGEVRLTLSALWSAMRQRLESGGEPFGVRVRVGEKPDESPRGLRLRAVRHQRALVARRDLQQRRHRPRERQAFAFRDFARIIQSHLHLALGDHFLARRLRRNDLQPRLERVENSG